MNFPYFRLIAALPAASPALIYGRAALLGLTGGERTCSSTYAKCPRDEDEILFYLNNHRGGFFKFFNEPGGSPSYMTTATTQSPLGLFMDFLGGDTTSGAASLMGSAGNTLGSFFGNVLQGLAGGTTSYARSSRDKRDIERRILTDVMEDVGVETTSTEDVDDIEQDEEAKMVISVPDDEQDNEETGEVEGRILNKGNIQADKPSSFVKFPYHEEEGLRNGRLYDPSEDYTNYIPEEEQDTLKFSQDHRYAKQYHYDGSYPEQSGTKVIFPNHDDDDRTGSLHFDNHRTSKVRFGRILNRPNYNSNNYHSNDADNYNNYYNRRPYYSRRDYGTTTDYKPPRYQPATRTTPKPADSDFEGNIYVTNSRGVVEYYINKQGRKVHV